MSNPFFLTLNYLGLAAVSDLLSTLTSSEISITGTTTATISTMHVASGTSSDYAITLPTAVGNAQKLIGFRMSPSLTKLVTLDGNGSETIDGSTTRIMWAGESALLLSDGSNWFKISGKSIPMICRIYRNSAQSITNNSRTKVTMNTVFQDNTGFLANLGSGRIDIKRPSNYQVFGIVTWDSINASQGLETNVYANGDATGTRLIYDSHPSTGSGSFSSGGGTNVANLIVGDYLELYVLQNSGSSVNTYFFSTQPLTSVGLSEILSW